MQVGEGTGWWAQPSRGLTWSPSWSPRGAKGQHTGPGAGNLRNLLAICNVAGPHTQQHARTCITWIRPRVRPPGDPYGICASIEIWPGLAGQENAQPPALDCTLASLRYAWNSISKPNWMGLLSATQKAVAAAAPPVHPGPRPALPHPALSSRSQRSASCTLPQP